MPTGPEAFLELPDMSGRWPGDRTHLKNGLVPYSYPGGAYDKYSASLFSYNALRSPFWTLVQSKAPKRNNGRLEAARPPTLAGLPPGARAATLTPCTLCMALDLAV